MTERVVSGAAGERQSVRPHENNPLQRTNVAERGRAGCEIRKAHIFKLVLFAALLIGACHPARGCIESSFELDAQSRVPGWFKIPEGLTRPDVVIILDYWGGFTSTRTATVTLRDARGRKRDSVVATMRGNEPHTVVPKPATGPIPYPSYEILTARGVTEVIEHRRMEPIFYVTDDAEVKRKLGVGTDGENNPSR